ncbi:MAG: sugar ABC transporter ATP-binding protein [Chloroflexi bacterium]|nr:sugar ABC transporter ATP-binding protein [Chloroflexota bacterium]
MHETPDGRTPLLQLRNVSKSFGPVFAVRSVDLSVYPSEIVALVGDNGAGKSTLIKLISGVHAPDGGEVYVRGRPVQHWDTATARRSGIETVYQDKALAEQQTVMRNLFMGREVTGPLGLIRLGRQRAEAEALMRRIGFTSQLISPDSVVATLSGGEREGVAIARAMYFKAELIILDEPTQALSLTQAQVVLNFMRHAKSEGSAVIFITHNVYHAHEVADRIAILDRGQIVGEFRQDSISAVELVEFMQAVARQGTSAAASRV